MELSGREVGFFTPIAGKKPKGGGAQFSPFFYDPFESGKAREGLSEDELVGRWLLLVVRGDFELGSFFIDRCDNGLGEFSAAVHDFDSIAGTDAHDVEMVDFVFSDDEG
jgi:hypothetical protein